MLGNFPAVQAVDVLLKKPEAPVNAEFDYMAVEVSQRREEV